VSIRNAPTIRDADNIIRTEITDLSKIVDNIDGVEMMLCADTSTLCAICNMRMMLAAALRQAQAGQETKMELVYQYLTSPKFRRGPIALDPAPSDATGSALKPCFKQRSRPQ